jgi:ribosomal protein S19E (S16A)
MLSEAQRRALVALDKSAFGSVRSDVLAQLEKAGLIEFRVTSLGYWYSVTPAGRAALIKETGDGE